MVILAKNKLILLILKNRKWEITHSMFIIDENGKNISIQPTQK